VKKKIGKMLLTLVLCWGLFTAAEGIRLIGSTDPGIRPMLHLSGVQAQDELADYHSLGFSQTYFLTEGDSFLRGEFRLFGLCIARW
jgi:hypothetical protein